MRQILAFTACAWVTASIASVVGGAEVAGTVDRPNILVILADDMGYSDLGCFGSEIETPELDALAADGLRLTQFYNTAKCHSSRVSLLTGQYCIAAGDTALTHAVTSAELLKQGGYFTAMTGKWHLKQQPTDFGFDCYFGHLSGACNYFKGDSSFRLNGQPWKVPATGFYTTVANVNFALKFLAEARQARKPWYLYVAFNAPHAPLHALPQDYARYKGRYDQGWDAVRAARVARQKRIGLLPASLQPSPRPEHIPDWDTLEPWRQKYEANRMATLAAMIDRVDQEVGRLVADLRSHGELENTFILFVSDNGACPFDRKPPLLDVEPTNGDVALADSTGWAWVRNSPFRYYKQNQFEGGISSPAIVHWPAGLRTPPGTTVREPAHLIDVLPTLADIAGCRRPASWPGRELRPVSGISLRPLFEASSLRDRPPIHLLFAADRGLRDGDWKIVSFRGQTWELYNVRDDRTELHDLAATEPERLQRMARQWTDMARDVLHARPGSYAPVKPAELPHHNPQWTDFDRALEDQPARNPRPANLIRARKNTQMTIRDGVLQLQFTGEDPGIAIDQLGELAAGPYVLSFRMTCDVAGRGDVFYTTRPGTLLPRGQRVTFDVESGESWQRVSVPLSTEQRIHKLRIDVCDGPGTAMISDLELRDQAGRLLRSWPVNSRGARQR